MQRLLLNRASVALTSNDVSLTPIPYTEDTVQNSKWWFPDNNLRLTGMHAYGVGLANPRIVMPTFADVSPFYVRPFEAAAAIPDMGTVADFRNYSVVLKRQENCDVQVSNTNAGAQTITTLLYVSDTVPGRVSGKTYSVKATAVTTATANAWTLSQLTFSNVFPNERFKIVDFDCVLSGGIAARIAISGNPDRPGKPILGSISDSYNQIYISEPFFDFGTFTSANLPAVEIYSSSAGFAEFWFTIVKV